MAGTAKPSYGTPNWELIQRWFALAPDDDGPFWALNLMKYHAVAQYGDGDRSSVSGKAADDAYSPLGPLAAVGAMVAFHGDVLAQSAGTPTWDRVAIVRYPSRAAFFAMQQRDDFKDQHVHKEAGMEFTIVMSCLPTSPAVEPAAGDQLVLILERGGTADPLPHDVSSIAEFDVEGVIVGDERTFDRARFVTVADDEAFDALTDHAGRADESQVLIVDRALDRLAESIATNTGTGA